MYVLADYLVGNSLRYIDTKMAMSIVYFDINDMCQIYILRKGQLKICLNDEDTEKGIGEEVTSIEGCSFLPYNEFEYIKRGKTRGEDRIFSSFESGGRNENERRNAQYGIYLLYSGRACRPGIRHRDGLNRRFLQHRFRLRRRHLI